MQIPDDFGERVRARRTDIGWSAAALSRRCAAERPLTEGQICAVEHGKKRPSLLDIEAGVGASVRHIGIRDNRRARAEFQ
jgi:hypothetical protein